MQIPNRSIGTKTQQKSTQRVQHPKDALMQVERPEMSHALKSDVNAILRSETAQAQNRSSPRGYRAHLETIHP